MPRPQIPKGDIATALPGRKPARERIVGLCVTCEPCVETFDGLTGNELWSLPSRLSVPNGSLHMDPSGQLVRLMVEKGDELQLREAASGKLMYTLKHCCHRFRNEHGEARGRN